MRGLEGKTVVVTGGGGGIGGAACKRFAEAGARIAVLDLDDAAARAVAGAVGAAATAFECDITSRGSVASTAEAVERELGGVDVLVNNAGWDVFRPFLKTDPALWEKLIAINLTGAMNMIHRLLPGMVERGAGRVVNVSSDAARVGSSGEAVYAACKAGLIALAKTLAREHARSGVTFNAVCPGPTETALFEGYKQGVDDPEKLTQAFRRAVPMGRLGQPEDIAGAIVFFASDEAAFVTGQVLSVSGGLTMNG